MSDAKVNDLNVKSAKDEAKAELQKERLAQAKDKLKSKMKEIEKAKLIVRNLERELEDLEHELAAGL